MWRPFLFFRCEMFRCRDLTSQVYNFWYFSKCWFCVKDCLDLGTCMTSRFSQPFLWYLSSHFQLFVRFRTEIFVKLFQHWTFSQNVFLSFALNPEATILTGIHIINLGSLLNFIFCNQIALWWIFVGRKSEKDFSLRFEFHDFV